MSAASPSTTGRQPWFPPAWLSPLKRYETLLMALAVGLLLIFMTETERGDVDDVMRASKPFPFYGTLDYADLRGRQARLTTTGGKRRLVCFPKRTSTDCFKGTVRESTDVRGTAFSYRGSWVVPSLRDAQSGHQLVDEARQRESIAWNSEVAAGSGDLGPRVGRFLLGFLCTWLLLSVKYLIPKRYRRPEA